LYKTKACSIVGAGFFYLLGIMVKNSW